MTTIESPPFSSQASALIQFGSDAPTAESYKAAFLEATANDTMGDFKLERSDAFTDVVEGDGKKLMPIIRVWL